MTERRPATEAGRGLDRDEAVRLAMLYVLQLSNIENKQLRALAPDAFVRALEQDGFTVVPTAQATDARVAALVEALTQYGDHWPRCSFRVAGLHCDCGLTDIIAKYDLPAAAAEPQIDVDVIWRLMKEGYRIKGPDGLTDIPPNMFAAEYARLSETPE